MRARHRHFNPAHADAAVALDARYGFNQSDNTTVDTWDDRSPNNNDATSPSTTALKPKFRTGIQGGSPALEFEGIANSIDRLNGSLTITNNVITTIAVVRLGLTGSAPSFARAISLSKNNANDYDSATRCIPLLRNSTNNQLYSLRSGSSTSNISISLDTWYHYTNTFNGSTNSARLNETTSQSISSSGNFDINQYRIGYAFDATSDPNLSNIGAWTGYIAHVSLFNAALSDSMRKRVQFANAFSYKLSCN